MGVTIKNPIKWSGSKRRLASDIIAWFPHKKHMGEVKQGTFYEMFCGGCSILLELLLNPYIADQRKYENYVCIDINKDLINLWKLIKTNPEALSDRYRDLWSNFNYEKVFTDMDNYSREYQYNHRKKFFNEVRFDFNQSQTYDLDKLSKFLFLLRTCFNGLVRYNRSGLYNSTCHFSRPGIRPKDLDEILEKTSKVLNLYGVEFIEADILDGQNKWEIKENDFVFLDPPYSGTSDNLMYQGAVDEEKLIEYLNSLPCSYALTFNGNRGENKGRLIELNNVELIELNGFSSSFSRLNEKNVIVNELLYLKQNN
jgi:DNA adenine methylase